MGIQKTKVVLLVVQTTVMMAVYTAFSGLVGIWLSLAFLCYTFGILEFGEKTGIATIAFLLSDTVYSLSQYQTLPYINLVCYAVQLIIFLENCIKSNKGILSELNKPKLIQVQQSKIVVISALIIVTVTLSNMAEYVKLEADILTIIIMQILQTMQVLVPISIAFRNKSLYFWIIVIYIVGNINSFRLLEFGVIDIVQTAETIFVMLQILVAYKINRQIYKEKEVIET